MRKCTLTENGGSRVGAGHANVHFRTLTPEAGVRNRTLTKNEGLA